MSLVLDVTELFDEVDAPPPSLRVPFEPSFKPTVLVATHSRSIRNAISVTLQSVGYRILTAGDAYDTAEHLQRSPEVGLVLLDQRLPGFDGFQLCKTIRQSDRFAPPVVLIAKRSGLWTRLKAKAAGAVALLKKPIRPDDLLTLVEEQLPLARS